MELNHDHASKGRGPRSNTRRSQLSNKDAGLSALKESTLKSTLLFVNNDAGTMSKGRKTPGTDVKTHVMLQSSRKKKLEAIERLRNPRKRISETPCTCRPWDQSKCVRCQTVTEEEQQIKEEPRTEEVEAQSFNELDLTSACQPPEKAPSDVELIHRFLSSSRPTLQNKLGGSVDPFACAVVPMTTRMNELLHFYVTVQLPIGYALNRNWQEVPTVDMTLGSAALLYSLLAGCAGHLEAYSGGSAKPVLIKYGDTETKVPESLAYKMNAISQINKAFADPVERLSDAVYFSLKAVCRSEILAGNRKEANLHFQGLQKLAQSRGSDVSSLFWDIAMVDIHMGCAIDAPPILPITYYGEDERQIWNLLEMETFHDSDLNAEEKLPLHPDVSKVVHRRVYQTYEDQRVLNLYRELCWRRKRDTTNPATGDDPVCCKRQLYIDHRLESISVLPDPWVETEWERAFRLATLVFTYPASMGHDPSSSRTRYPSLRLLGQLYATDLDAFWTNAPSLLFWILFMGAFATQGYPERPWFVGNIVKGAMILQTFSWSDVRGKLMGFFYLPWVHDAAFKKIWEEVEAFMVAAEASK